MKKQIRKAVLEAKQKKDILILETELVKKRFDFILKDIKSKEDYMALSENKKIKLLFTIANEYNQLNAIIVSEQFDLGGFLKSIFGNLFGSSVETVAEPFVNRILSAIGLSGYWKNVLISFFTSNPSEFFQAFSDCKMMTKLVTRSLVEGLVMNLKGQMGVGGMFADWVRNLLGDSIREIEFVKKLEDNMSEVVCSLFSKFGENASQLSQTLSPILSASPTK